MRDEMMIEIRRDNCYSKRLKVVSITCSFCPKHIGHHANFLYMASTTPIKNSDQSEQAETQTARDSTPTRCAAATDPANGHRQRVLSGDAMSTGQSPVESSRSGPAQNASLLQAIQPTNATQLVPVDHSASKGLLFAKSFFTPHSTL